MLPRFSRWIPRLQIVILAPSCCEVGEMAEDEILRCHTSIMERCPILAESSCYEEAIASCQSCHRSHSPVDAKLRCPYSTRSLACWNPSQKLPNFLRQQHEDSVPVQLRAGSRTHSAIFARARLDVCGGPQGLCGGGTCQYCPRLSCGRG